MPSINAHGMSEVEKNLLKRKETLNTLISKQFDLDNEQQIQELRRYMSEFELSKHQMYLYQGMGEGLKAWGASWIVGLFLPIPAFAGYLLTSCLYLGVIGYTLERFSMSDFYERLSEMKTLYNWCLKNGNEAYNSQIDNTAKLANPDIIRLIQLIAPLCSVDFMLAWPREVVQNNENNAGWGSVASSFYVTVSSSIGSFFYRSAPSIDPRRIKELKIAVENREYDIGAFKGFEHSIGYFTTNTEFRALLSQQVKQPIHSLKQIIPDLLASSNTNPSSLSNR